MKICYAVLSACWLAWAVFLIAQPHPVTRDVILLCVAGVVGHVFSGIVIWMYSRDEP